MANEQFSKGLPSSLVAPAFVDTWRTRALIAGLVFSFSLSSLLCWGRRRMGWVGITWCGGGSKASCCALVSALAVWRC